MTADRPTGHPPAAQQQRRSTRANSPAPVAVPAAANQRSKLGFGLRLTVVNRFVQLALLWPWRCSVQQFPKGQKAQERTPETPRTPRKNSSTLQRPSRSAGDSTYCYHKGWTNLTRLGYAMIYSKNR